MIISFGIIVWRFFFRLLESLDETIYTSGVKLVASPLTRSRSPSPHASKRNGRLAGDHPDAVDGGIAEKAASGEFDWFADKPSCPEVGEWVRRKVPESLARVWLLEIVLAVEALHDVGIFCVDLAMHNVLLGEKGIPFLSGTSEKFSNRTFTKLELSVFQVISN